MRDVDQGLIKQRGRGTKAAPDWLGIFMGSRSGAEVDASDGGGAEDEDGKAAKRARSTSAAAALGGGPRSPFKWDSDMQARMIIHRNVHKEIHKEPSRELMSTGRVLREGRRQAAQLLPPHRHGRVAPHSEVGRWPMLAAANMGGQGAEVH